MKAFLIHCKYNGQRWHQFREKGSGWGKLGVGGCLEKLGKWKVDCFTILLPIESYANMHYPVE